MFKKIIVMSFLFSLLFGSSLFGASEAVMRANINHAGKLNTRVQKAMKHVVLISSGFDKKTNIKGLKKSAKLFDKTIKIFLNGGKNKFGIKKIEDVQIRGELKKTLTVWKSFYKKISKKSFNKKALEEIDTLHNKLLKMTDKFVLSLTNDCKDITTVKIDTATDMYEATKQRTRAERIATLSALIYKEINVEANKQKLQDTITKYERVVNGLIDGDKRLGLHKIKINDIKKQLKKTKKYWSETKPSIELNSFDKSQVAEVVKNCTNLRIMMAKGVKLYQRSAKRQRKQLALSNIVNIIMEVGSKKEHVINLSIKQAVRSQKLAKHSLLIAMSVEVEKNRKGIKKSATLFNKTLIGLISRDKKLKLSPTKTPEILAQLKVVENMWRPFFDNINLIEKDSSNRKAIIYIIQNNEKLLKASQKVVRMFEKDRHFSHNIDDTSTKQIKFTGKLRMFSQKTTKEKLLILGGMDVESNSNKLGKCIASFDKVLNGLLEGDSKMQLVATSDKSIRTQLGKVKKMWLNLKPLYQNKNLSDSDLAKIIGMNDPLRVEINKAVTLFENSVDN